MSTPNFYNDDFFDLYVFPDSDDEFIYDDPHELDYAIERATKELKREPQFFNIELASGHYCGIQLKVNPCSAVRDYGTPAEQENYLCRYHWDMSRSEAMRKFESEKKWMNNKLLPAVAKLIGFKKLNCVGVFSNGEAVYEWAK